MHLKCFLEGGSMEIKEGFVICNQDEKKNILESIKGFKNYIFLSYQELKNNLYGTCKKDAVFKLMEKYQISYDLALEYMKYAPYAFKDEYSNEKLNKIAIAKKYLIEDNYLEKDEFFYYRLKQFPVTFLFKKNTKEFDNIIQLLKQYTEVIIQDKESRGLKPLVNVYNSLTDEVYGICNQIIELKKKGISYNSIYLMNLNPDYKALFERMERSYKIPFDLGKDKNISHTKTAKKLFELMNEDKSFNEIIESMASYPYIDSIMRIVIDYSLEDKKSKDYIHFFKRKLKEISYDKDEYEEMVRVTDRINFNDSEYVFYLGLNQGITPKVYKDDEYLSDKELEELSLQTSYMKNIDSKRDLKWVLENTLNIYPSYPKKALDKDLLPSAIIHELELKEEEKVVEFGYSKDEDLLRLGVYMSLYSRLGEKNEALDIYDLDSIPFNEYDHSYKTINLNYIKNRYTIDTPLSLSYSTMKLYFECPFKFYCNQILNLNTFESSTATRLGSYSHKILEESYSPDFNFEKNSNLAKEEYLKDISKEDYLKDSFYLSQMNEVLKNLITFNQGHEKISLLNNVSRECHIKVVFGNYYFHGFIDKLLYTIDGDDIYAAIIDYKTGKDIASLNNIEDGFNMQLPSYMWLLKQYEPFKGKNIHIIGIYLQKVRIVALDNSIDLLKQMKESFMLEGFTIKDFSLIPYLDPYYQASDYIKSMKVSKDNSFYKYAKVISNKNLNIIIDTLDKNIKKTYDALMDADFKIEPKKIDLKDKSCEFCDFKDICYKKLEDYKYLDKKEFKEEEE